MNENAPQPVKTPSQLIDQRIDELGDWRGGMLATLRAIVLEAIPDVEEDWKWRGVPVWYSNGIVCTGETHKTVVKMTFAKGAALADPSGMFNSSLDGNPAERSTSTTATKSTNRLSGNSSAPPQP